MIRFAWHFSASGPWWTCTSWNWGRLRRKVHAPQEGLEVGVGIVEEIDEGEGDVVYFKPTIYNSLFWNRNLMEVPMKRMVILTGTVIFGLVVGCSMQAEKTDQELIAEAESAGVKAITQNATIKTSDGKVLREGTNDWTCYPGTEAMGPMCNQAQWDSLLGAYMKKEPIEIKELSVSYMLAGEGEAIGVSNTDPFASEPTDDNDWVKEGPHLMILVPNAETLEGLSTDTKDPVYVMWKGTPYAHIMVKISEDE